jgi:RNA recognition motif-containing protein
MGKKLFVGGLSWATDDELLRQAFEKFGAVEDARVITDRETGRSRGFGFVSFDAPDSAEKAMSEMDGADLDGRSLKVNEAQEKPRNNDRGGARW